MNTMNNGLTWKNENTGRSNIGTWEREREREKEREKERERGAIVQLAETCSFRSGIFVRARRMGKVRAPDSMIGAAKMTR